MIGLARAAVLLALFIALPSSAVATVVGSLQLTPCGSGRFCGSIDRPLDPRGRVRGHISIHFRYYLATHTRHAVGTIVTVEGGPGFSSIGSANAYLALFGPLRSTYNMLIVDNRGTGLSHALDCEPLQRQIVRQPAALARCARDLGAAAYLYSSANAADDLAAVLDGLHIDRVDLYGDSYGTFFGQTFAVRHRERVRTLMLDSAYPVIGESAWYPYQAPSASRAFNLACTRTAACASLGGTSMARIDALIAALRRHPFIGHAPDGNGRMRTVRVDAPGLAAQMIAESNAPTVYRELDAATRSYLAGDVLPLARIFAEGRLANPENGAPKSPSAFSEALFVTVQCGDYPQLYDLRAPAAQRHLQLAAAIRAERLTHTDVFAPFTIDEAQRAPYNDNAVALCVDWARASPREPLAQPVPFGATFPETPVLVLSGELDTVTTPAEGREAARLFPRSTWLLVPNSIHETAISDGGNNISPGADLSGCVNSILLRFVRTRVAGDTSCLRTIRPIRVVPAFPLQAAAVPGASPRAENKATARQLRVAAAVIATVGDALNRYWENSSGSGVGLRGGTLTIANRPDGYDFILDLVRYTTDLATTGTLHWDQARGVVSGAVDVSGAGYGKLTFRWSERAVGARASIDGYIDGKLVAATCPAP